MIPLFFETANNVIKNLDNKYKVSFTCVDDGSKDRTLDLLKKQRKIQSNIRIISFSRVVKYDSIKHYSWNVTADSTITMRDFPVCKLDSAIFIPKNDNSNRAQELAALRTAIHESQNTVEKFTSKYFVPNTSYQHQYGYKFAVFPKTIKQSFFYNGKAHDVYFIFDLAGYIGTYASNSFVDKIFEYNMVLSGICVDEYKESNLISDIYFRQVLMTCTTK